MLKRFWQAVISNGFCGDHEFVTKSSICCRCGYNVTKPVVLGKDRSKSRVKRKKR